MWRTPFNDNEERFGSAVPTWQAVVSGTTVFLPLAAGDRRKPTAVDGATGAVKWTYDGPYRRAYDYGDDGSFNRVPGVQGVLGVGGGFVLPTGKGTVCLDADDARKRWHCAADGGRLAGGHVLFTSSHERLFGQWGHVRVLDARTGREVWAGDFATTFATDPTAGGDLVFVADKDGKLWALRI